MSVRTLTPKLNLKAPLLKSSAWYEHRQRHSQIMPVPLSRRQKIMPAHTDHWGDAKYNRTHSYGSQLGSMCTWRSTSVEGTDVHAESVKSHCKCLTSHPYSPTEQNTIQNLFLKHWYRSISWISLHTQNNVPGTKKFKTWLIVQHKL